MTNEQLEELKAFLDRNTAASLLVAQILWAMMTPAQRDDLLNMEFPDRLKLLNMHEVIFTDLTEPPGSARKGRKG